MSEKSSPVHMSGAVDAPPFSNADWAWNVVHRNAPGAISAIAFTVTPVSVRLRFISPLLGAAVSAMNLPLLQRQGPPLVVSACCARLAGAGVARHRCGT